MSRAPPTAARPPQPAPAAVAAGNGAEQAAVPPPRPVPSDHPAVTQMRAVADLTKSAEDAVSDLYRHTLTAVYQTVATAYRGGGGTGNSGTAVPAAAQPTLDTCTDAFVSRLIGLANDAADRIVKISEAGDTRGEPSQAAAPAQPSPTQKSSKLPTWWLWPLLIGAVVFDGFNGVGRETLLYPLLILAYVIVRWLNDL